MAAHASFRRPPSSGFCAGVGAWKIRRGKFGDIPLDGLALGFSVHWPQAIHLGNWLFRARPCWNKAAIYSAPGAARFSASVCRAHTSRSPKACKSDYPR